MEEQIKSFIEILKKNYANFIGSCIFTSVTSSNDENHIKFNTLAEFTFNYYKDSNPEAFYIEDDVLYWYGIKEGIERQVFIKQFIYSVENHKLNDKDDIIYWFFNLPLKDGNMTKHIEEYKNMFNITEKLKEYMKELKD